MAQKERSFGKGEWVLVTGANGYIASHVVDTLLEQVYSGRGAVRTGKPWLNKLFNERHGDEKFETFVVSSLDAEGAYDEAVKGASGILHLVSSSAHWLLGGGDRSC